MGWTIFSTTSGGVHAGCGLKLYLERSLCNRREWNTDFDSVVGGSRICEGVWWLLWLNKYGLGEFNGIFRITIRPKLLLVEGCSFCKRREIRGWGPKYSSEQYQLKAPPETSTYYFSKFQSGLYWRNCGAPCGTTWDVGNGSSQSSWEVVCIKLFVLWNVVSIMKRELSRSDHYWRSLSGFWLIKFEARNFGSQHNRRVFLSWDFFPNLTFSSWSCGVSTYHHFEVERFWGMRFWGTPIR